MPSAAHDRRDRADVVLDVPPARRTDYMRYAYLQLGSDADVEEAVGLTFDQVMDR